MKAKRDGTGDTGGKKPSVLSTLNGALNAREIK